MGNLIGVLLGLLAAALFLFYLLAFPIWMLVQCAVSTHLSKKAKALWLLSIVVTATAGAALFGLFASRKRSVQWISGVGLAACVAVAALTLVGLTSFAKETPAALEKALARMEEVQSPELSKQEMGQLRDALQTLLEEVRQSPWYRVEGKVAAMNLQRFLMHLAADSRLSQEDYHQWKEKFESRRLLDQKAFEEYVKQLGSS